MELPHHEGSQRPIRLEIGAEQNAGRLDAPGPQKVLKEPGRHVQNSNGLTHQGQRHGQVLESLSITRRREVARPSP